MLMQKYIFQLYLNLTRSSLYLLFPAIGIVSYRELISTRNSSLFYVCLKETC